MDMCNCLKMPTSRIRKLLSTLFVFVSLCVSAQAETYYWIGGAPDNNWSTLANWNTALDGTGSTPAAAPGAGDNVYFPKDATVNLDSDITVTEIQIPNPNLETNSFSVKLTGSHSITATSKIETFRAAATGAADKATSTFVFNCDVTSPSLIMHSGGNITLGEGKTASITNIENQGEDSPATMLTVNGFLTSNSIQMSAVTTRLLTVSSTGSITANSITGSAGSVTNNGLIVTQTPVDSSLVGSGNTPVTPSAGEIVWTGAVSTAWNIAGNWVGGTPTANAVVLIPAGITHYPALSETTAALQSLTINSGASISIETGGTLNSAAITNYGTISISGGTITDTPTVTNGPDSTVTYSGSITTPIWGNSYQNLTVESGTSISFDSTTTVSGKATNNGTITIKTDAFSADSIENGSSSTIIYDGATTPVWGNSYQNLTVQSGTSITFSANTTVTGTATNNGTITFGAHTFTAATKTNGSNSSIIYDGATSSVWGDIYQDLTVTSGTTLSFSNETTVSGSFENNGTITFDDNATVTGTTTNNGTITFGAHTFTAGTKVNGPSGTIIYDGATSPVWGNTYQNLTVESSTSLSFADATTVSGSLENNGTITFGNSATVSGTTTNNGTIKFGTHSFTAGTKVNGPSGTIIYDGTTSPVWGDSYQNLTVASDTSLSFANTTTVSGSLENNGTITFNEDLTVTDTATNNGTIIFGSHSFSAATKVNGASSTIIYDGATSPVWGGSYQNLTVRNGTNLSFANATTVSGSLENNGTISFSNTATISGTATNNGIITIFSNTFSVTGAKTNGTSSKIIYNNASALGWGENYENLEVASGGLTLSANSTITASSITFDGPVNIPSNALTLNSPTININDNIQTDNLTIPKGTISVDDAKTLTVNGTLSLGSEGNTTTVQSASSGTQWTLHCTGENNHTITNTTIKDSNNTSEYSSSSYNLIATSSTDGGNNTNWIFDGVEYVWQGVSTVWNTPSNWLPASIPASGSTVKIPKNKTNYPELTTDLTLFYNSLYPGSITIEKDDAELTHGKLIISGGTLKVGTITNNGDISLSGGTLDLDTITNNNLITISGGSISNTTTRENGTSSKIIYDANMTSIWGTSYNNLEITSGKAITFDSNTEIKGDLSSLGNTDGSGYLIFNGADDQTFSAGTGTFSKIKENKTQNKLTISGNCIITNFDITQGTETIFSNNPTIINLSITVGGQTRFSGQPTIGSITDAASAGAITFADSATIQSDVSFNTTGTVSFVNNTNILTTGSPDTYHSITHTAGITEINGTLKAADVTLNKTNLTGTTNIVAYGNVTFANTTSGGSTTYANVSNNQDLTITTTGEGTSTTFNGDVGKTDATKLKSLTINGDTNIRCTLIATSGNQTYNGNINLYSNSTNNSVILTTNASSEIDFSGNITKGVTKAITFTIDSPTFKSTAAVADPLNPPTITVECNEIEFSKDNTEIASEGALIQFTVPKISGTGKTVTLAASVSELSFSGNVEFNPNITTTTGSHFKASSGTMTFKADVNFEDNSLTANNGTIILTAENITPAGTAATLSGNNTFNNLTLQGPVIISGSNTIANLNIQDSATISGNNTITNLTAGDETTGLGDKTITFAAASTQTVNGTLKLNGSSETSRLILRSSTAGNPWNILCQGTNTHSIHFVDISDSLNQSSYNLFAITSNDSGNNTKWNFPGMIYTWNGSTNDSWNTAANWTPSSIPGKGAEVRIAEVTSPASTLLLSSDLDLTDSYNGTNYNGTITVNAGAVFDLAGNNLSVGTITNNGLVRLTGASTQTITAAMNNGAASTVEYYGAGAATSNFAWDGDNGSGSAGRQYENLIISRAISQNTDEENKLQVSGTTTIIAGSTNSVSLNNPYNIFSGHVILGNHSTSISAGTVTLNGTGAGSVAIFLEENIFADNLTLNSNVRGDTLTFLTPLTVNTAQVSSNGTQIYNSPVSITHNANFVSGSGSLINFADTITGNGTASLTISTADSKFEGIVSNLSSLTTDANTTINANLTIDSLFTQTASLNCTAITTSGNQNYHGAVTLGNNSLLTLTADNIIFDSTIDGAHPVTFSIPDNPEKTISVAGIIGQTATPAITITQAGTVNFTNLVKSSSFEITKANSTTFNDTVEINTFTDTSDAGNISFKNGGTISNPTGTEFLTTGTVTFGDSSEDSILFGTTSTYANLTHTTGNTLIAGTLNANNITFTDAVLTDDTSIISQGTQNFTGTINDSTAGSHQLILNSNNSQITFTQNIGETTAPRILTVNGPSAINCQLVKTTESQTYNNAITGDDSISLESAVINLNCSTITTNGSQTFNGPTILQSSTTLTSDTGDLHFTSTVNGSHKLTLAKANISTFDNTVEVTDFEITQAAATNFEATATISSFTDSPSAGNISFKNGGTISSSTGTTFLTSGTVTLGNGADNTFNFGNSGPYANLTHTAGITSINGVINAACITLGETTGGQITLNNTDLFKTTDGSPLNYSTSFTQIGTANSILGGSFTGNGNASFTTNVLLFGSSPADFGSTDNNISINKNLIISRSAELTINATLAITNNLVIYNGDITTNADISAADDILLLGNAYNTKDDTTGIEDEFVYTTPRHNNWSQPNYIATELPGGSTLPTDYSGTLSVAAGKTILAGKNLYINGSTMALAGSTGQWNLSLPDISDPSKAFAEAYYTSINGCKVILHSSDSNVSDSAKEDGTYARLAALECTDNGTTNSQNQNIEFEDFMITNAFTVRDNVIRVEFNQPIRYHTTTIGSLNFHDSSDSPEPDFTGFYSDPDCTQEHELKSDIQLSYLNPDDNKTYYYFYIKAASQDSAATGAWNTDATGKSIGAENEKSSDRDGIHHATFPCLDFPRSLKKEDGSTLSFIITDRWGKRLNNYSKRPSTTATEPAYGALTSSKEVTDKTGPVLWSVRTGQELHTAYNPAAGAASQHSYDSHNFLEFRYSEPVEFYEQNNLRTITENFQVTDELGAIAEDITRELNTITFAGLAKLNAASGTSLKLHTGIQGMVSKYTSALYRTDEYSVRISIAGWTDGTVTDYSGNIYKKWPGYIETAYQFTNATAIAFTDNNSSIKDLNQNNQIEYAAGCRKEPVVLSDSSGNHTANLIPTSPDLYSKWDLSEPYFTPLRNSVTSTITASDNDWSKTNERSEAIGNTNGTGSTLDRIDFHFFDNTPNFDDTDEAEWFTEVGWCLPGTSGSKSNLKDSSYTYAADIIGGARQFDTIASRRTSGGIRFSSKLFAAPGFKYSTDQDAVPETPFATGLENVHSTVVSQLFTGSSEPRHAANDPDGLYLGLGITDTALPVETTFSFSYDESAAYLTDLAGNRLRSKTSKTIDRTPPSFDIILSPVNQNQIYIVFVKQIVTSGEGIRICDADGNPQTVENNLLALLPDCFQLVRISEDGTYTATDENDITIDSSVPASIIEQYSDNHFTCICLRTTRNITFDDVRNLHIQLKNHKEWPEKSQDPFTSNKNARVTFIQDGSGNYMPMYSAHALSDFAINYVNPLYAYSSDITEDENPVMDGLYENGSWAVHNWNADQNKYGTLPSDHSAAIVTALEDNSENTTTPDIRVYLSDSPDRDSVSKQFNKDFKTSLRVWLPELSDGIFRALTATNNSNFSFVDSELLTQNNQSSQNELDSSNNLIFNIPLEMIQKWKSGDQISFMFGITNTDGTPVRIYNNPYFDIENNRYDFSHNIPVPLYSLRMHDTTDIGTLDLWSFRLKGITGQRGGVTILNNVINAANGEKTVIKVDVPAEGKLNVIVMTLDGNIITYLHRGNAKTGENYFTWDGKNRSGSAVARGMYFIRVVGTDFDETRKVMVVK